MIAIKRYIEHFRLSRVILSFAKKKLFVVALSGSGNKSHRLDFLGDFRSFPLPETVPGR
jgi:hypothetical protein